jgi:hypothetical protein
MPFNPEQFIEYVQRDALNSPFANPTDQEELEMTKQACRELEHIARLWQKNYEEMKTKWHEARRYLRAANKGAERNNQVMRLQSYDISRLLERIKELQQSNQ